MKEEKMTPLRTRMIEDMRIRGMSPMQRYQSMIAKKS